MPGADGQGNRRLWQPGSVMSISSTSRPKISATHEQRRRAHRQTQLRQRFHQTILDEFYRIALRKKLCCGHDELHAALDEWLKGYDEDRPHQGHGCFWKTPMQAFIDAISVSKGKHGRSLTQSDRSDTDYAPALSVRSNRNVYT